jgi:transposase
MVRRLFGCRGDGALSLSVLTLDPANLKLQDVKESVRTATIYVQATGREAECPLCHKTSDRIHSRYMRRLADLPSHGQAIEIRLRVRRFFCSGSDCPRRIFAERLSFAAAFVRTTNRLRDIHAEIGSFLGGEPGARLASRLAMPTSPDTLLRRIRQMSLAITQPVRVLGIDDWAFRRGQRYGTILCDLERRRPVDLLPERSAETIRNWLRAHPEVEIISRDRADDYIKGATEGAPQAVQVADRWHLLRNLGDAMRRLVDRLGGKLRKTVGALQQAIATEPSTESPGTPKPVHTPPESPRQTRYTQNQQEHRQRRLEHYEQVKALRRQGLGFREIGRQLGLNRATVRRFAQSETFPERATRRTAKRTDSVADFILRRWQQGCRNAAQLFEELKAKGFDGSYYMVRRRLARWRLRANDGQSSSEADAPLRMRFSPRQLARLLLKPGSELSDKERSFRDRLEQHDDEVRKAGELGRQFREIVRGRKAEAWTDWIIRSQQATVPAELQRFAKGLQEDEKAVTAALALPWSNGQVEGQVNRLKTLKRQMYGRANFDLLRLRFLLAA